MFCIENKKTRGGSRTPGSSMMELFVTILCQEVILYWQSNSNLDDVWIVDLPLMLLFSVSIIKLEAWGRTKTQRTQAFHILVLSFFSRSEECNLLLPLLRNGCACSLIDTFVFWRFYKVLFESILLFWFRINCKGIQSQEICHFETWNLLNHQSWFEKLSFQSPK